MVGVAGDSEASDGAIQGFFASLRMTGIGPLTGGADAATIEVARGFARRFHEVAEIMFAYVVLLIALLSRLLPPLLHIQAMNFTAVGGSLLFFGARRPKWQSAVAVGALMVADFLLTVYAYHYPFHVRSYLVTWLWYAAICLMGYGLLRRVTVARVGGAALISATSFFLLSNFMVWTGHMYQHTAAGLAACYVAALPFYRSDLISTALTAGVLFGIPVVAARLAEISTGQERVA